jgi:hypothetical protein
LSFKSCEKRYPKSFSRSRCLSRSGNFLKVGAGAGAETNSFGSTTLKEAYYRKKGAYHRKKEPYYRETGDYYREKGAYHRKKGKGNYPGRANGT